MSCPAMTTNTVNDRVARHNGEVTTLIEPGLLNLFRWYVGIRLGVLLAVLVATRGDNPPEPPQFPQVGIVLFGLLLVLLLVPWFERALGRAFLPTAVVLATVAPIADAVSTIDKRLALGFTPNEALTDYWVPFFLLFVPFIIVAWQYRYRWVLVFAVGSTVLDLVATGGALAAHTDEFAPTGLDLTVLGALLIARAALFAFLGLFISKLVARQREDRAKLQGYAAAVEQLSVGRERNRMARELHDTLAHSMTGTVIQLEAALAVWQEDPARAEGLVERALDATRSGLSDARRAIGDLRASPLEERGLEGSIEWLVADAEDVAGISAVAEIAKPLPLLPPDLEHTVFRIVEEAVTNVVRHAEASRIDVRLEATKTMVTVTVADDGKGFAPGSVDPDRHGLTGMAERAKLVGGSLDVDSEPGGGSTLVFTAPIVHQRTVHESVAPQEDA